jgi:hypothetical protein
LSKKRGATSSAHIPDYRKSDIALHHDVDVPATTTGEKEVMTMISAEKMRLDTAENNNTKVVLDTSPEENTQSRRHHRRTSSNDVTDIKRLRLSTPNFENANEESSTTNGLSSTSTLVRNATVVGAPGQTAANTATATINTRRAATPDHRMSSSSFLFHRIV